MALKHPRLPATVLQVVEPPARHEHDGDAMQPQLRDRIPRARIERAVDGDRAVVVDGHGSKLHASSDVETGSAFGSGISVSVASVSSSTLATDTAFSSAARTTLVGSMMPASIRST